MNKKTLITVLMIFVFFLSSPFLFAETTGNYVYVGNMSRTGGNSISIVDIVNNTIIKTIQDVHGPAKIFVSPNGLKSFVVESGTFGRDSLVIDTVTQTIAKPLLEEMAQVQTITISPDSSRAFVAAYNPYQAWTGGECRFGGGIHTFDTSTYQHLSCFDTAELYPYAMFVRPDDKYLYTGFYYNRDTTIAIYDIETLSYVKSLDLYIKSHSYHRVNGMAPDSSGRYLYVTGRSYEQNDYCPCDLSNFGYLYTIDMLTNEVINTLTVPVSQFGEIAISPNGLYACIIDIKYNKLYIFNLQNYSYESLDMGEQTNIGLPNLIISPDSSNVYLLKLNTFKVAVVDLNNASEVDNIQLDNKPYQMIMTPDGKYLYVTIPSSNVVSVIDTASNTIIKNISGFSYPSPIAFVSANIDIDDDGILDNADNCPDISNADQADNDVDGEGDVCDTDDDNDTILDTSDNCLFITNSDQADNDGDNIGDVCDEDDDNDNILDVNDNCKFDANPDQDDLDNDGLGDVCDEDPDGDGIIKDDNCKFNPNPIQEDNDADGIGDVCDNDDDNDGELDGVDNCPTIANSDQADLDKDNIGDACDIDIDGDGVNNDVDNCILTGNHGQDDSDYDGVGDACDEDDDNDGVLDVNDNCSLIANPSQNDADQDGRGDLCDDDLDGDGVDNSIDNCPVVANSSQNDFDGDGLGDACDPDIDEDGVVNGGDICSETSSSEIVDSETGCSIAQLCPCEGPRGTTVPWKNHGKYVSCVAKSSESFVGLGLITEAEKDIIVSNGAQSECGNKK